MRNKLFFVPIVLCSLMLWGAILWAADSFTPLNVKEGLWELTVTRSMSGMPAMPNIPPETLAQMPPEQRARVEAMMKGGSSPTVQKECVTKDKLAKNAAFSANRGDCTRTVVNSTGRKLEAKLHCEEKNTTSDGTILVEAIGTDNVKSTIHTVSNGNGHNITMDMTVTSKYLGPDCGDVK